MNEADTLKDIEAREKKIKKLTEERSQTEKAIREEKKAVADAKDRLLKMYAAKK